MPSAGMNTPLESRPERAWVHLLAFLGYLALTLVFLRPAAFVFGSHIAPDPGDPLFNMFVLKWGVHEMRTGMHGFWDAPIFFPLRHATTFSDHLLGPAAVATLFTAVIPNPIAAYNLFFVGSFVLCGFTAWWVLRRSGLGAAAAFLGGCMFAFSPFRWDQLSHLQVLLMHWIPVTLWSWDRLLAGPSWRRAGVFLLFYALHVTGGSYLGYMIHYPMLVLLLFRAPALWQGGRRRALRVLTPVGIIAGLILAAVYLPYLLASGHQMRTPQEIQIFGASLASYATAGDHNLYGAVAEGWRRPENSLFAGILATLLTLLAGWRGWRRLRNPPRLPLTLSRRITLWALAATVVLCWVLSELRVWELSGVGRAPQVEVLSAHRLGVLALAAGLLALALRRIWSGGWPLRLGDLDPWPRGLLVSGALCFLLTFPLVSLPLMRVIPGLGGMRVPARFYAFVSFSLAFFAAGELDRWLREPARRRRLVGLAGTAALLLLLVDITPRPVEWSPLAQEAAFPRVYHWLARQRGVDAVLELPMQDNSTDILYMYYATLHWKPLVNGYSGYIPDHYILLQKDCCFPLPDPEHLQRLRDWGVSHVLLHKETLDRRWKRRQALRWGSDSGVRIEYDDPRSRVYRIAGPAVSAKIRPPQ
jgi:Ca2+/Na+ antiporter